MRLRSIALGRTWSFQQTRVGLSRGFGAMGKVAIRMVAWLGFQRCRGVGRCESHVEIGGLASLFGRWRMRRELPGRSVRYG
jgi:hypothetical protein